MTIRIVFRHCVGVRCGARAGARGRHGAAGLANNIAQGDIKEFAVPLPPVDEQAAIVAHIATETATLDALRSATERTIALLKERRTALIAAAVTGRLHIPEAA